MAPSLQSSFLFAIRRTASKSSPFICIRARYNSTVSDVSATSSQKAFDSYLITPQALNNALKKDVYTKLSTSPRLLPLCASWFMPNDPQKRTGKGAYLAGHVPRARFFDIDAVCDTSSPYPHMLPTPEHFAKEMSKLGLRRDDNLVVYDSAELGIFSAPRVAWTLKVFGHPSVNILNNFKLWVDQGLPVEKGEPEDAVEETQYPVPQLDTSRLITYENLKENILERGKEGAEDFTIVDARSKGRWDGSAAEPREGKVFALL
jgi:thiosulfate/3-mercaptopyruvate sulfurtransferase